MMHPVQSISSLRKALALLACAIVLPISALAADEEDDNEPPRNHVYSVKLDGFPLFTAFASSRLPESFLLGERKISVSGEDEEVEVVCDPGVSLDYSYKGRTLAVFSSNANHPDNIHKKLLAKPTPDPRRLPLKVRVDVSWDDMSTMTGRLEIDGRVISPDMSFAEFKKLYPISAKAGWDDTDAAGKPTGIKIYTLIFGDEKYAIYTDHIDFGFRNGKLVRLLTAPGYCN
jgi:hypothetical protein